MNNILFNPPRIDPKSQTLILIPYFWHKAYYAGLRQKAEKVKGLLQSDLLYFGNFTLLCGFLGYPALLTLLEFIDRVRQLQVIFLGTAGSLNPGLDHHLALCVSRIYGDAAFQSLSKEPAFDLQPIGMDRFPQVHGISVDIIQRETAEWLGSQIARGIDVVEMELYPLRVYLGRPFRALVVTTDLLTERGIRVFPDRERLNKEFVSAFEWITRYIDER